MRMFDFLRRGAGPDTAAPEAKASATGRIAALGSAGRTVWGARDTTALTRSGFMANPVGFRTVKMIAEAVAALPLILQDSARRYETHPVLDLIRRPNGVQSKAEFVEALIGQLLLTGNGYVEAVGAGDGLPLELHVLRSDRMALIGEGPRPVCHIRSFHPQDDHYGLSPMQAAATAVEVHNAASRWSKALLDNAARPSGAIVYKGADGQGQLSPDQFDRLLMEMETQHQGARNAGRPMLLEGGLDWKPMGFSPSDMEFQKTKESAAREIAIAFGVPPMLLGIPGDATYANYQEANRAFYRLTVLPLATRVTGALVDWLDDFTGEELSLRPDLDQVPALASEREAQWRRIGAVSFLSDAEKRALLGLPPLELGDG